MPKNRYITEREAFDCEREIFHRRRFRTLMKAILRNQNRRFKLLLVIGFYKLISNTLLKSAMIDQKKPSNLHQRGGSDSLRRSMLYHLGGGQPQEFPYNVGKRSQRESSVHERPPWQPEDSELIKIDETKDQEAEFAKQESAAHLRNQKLKRAYQRLEAIGRLRRTPPKSSEAGERPPSREAALKRGLINVEMLPARQVYAGKEGDKKNAVQAPTKAEAVRTVWGIMSMQMERKAHRALLKWSFYCKNKLESEYLEEIENVNIVLSERTFRERVFRTKIRLLQETIETQIKQFEDISKSAHA